MSQTHSPQILGPPYQENRLRHRQGSWSEKIVR